jgi:hypothetical protein
MKYDIVTEKETMIQNEIVFFYVHKKIGLGGGEQEEQKIYTYSSGMTIKEWKKI